MARYRLLQRLGRGGLTEVFEAELVGEPRKIAIKRMLEPAAADPVAARRFLDEAALASRLHHANVVSVIDLGLLDDRPFQAVEYVDGIDAQRLLARAGRKLPIQVALAIATAVARALDHAHAACDQCGLPLGIVHRDVRPSSVLVSWSGDVKLGDFGIAGARGAGFLAPEQHELHALDGRTDVFLLGLTLHALVTGHSPLREPLSIEPALPEDVRAILGAALAIDRLARPTAGELAAALAPLLVADRRTTLRDFLAPFAPTTTHGTSLGIDVVETADSHAGLHRYETRRT